MLIIYSKLQKQNMKQEGCIHTCSLDDKQCQKTRSKHRHKRVVPDNSLFTPHIWMLG